MFEENINYYKKMQVPVRIIENKGGELKAQKQIKLGGFGFFQKKIVKILLILAFLSSQVYLVSAFEAHVVNVTARICGSSETRTMGFWKNHYNAYKNCLPVTLGDHPDDLELTTKQQVEDIFELANADVMEDMLRGQLLAMKFNICYFGIETGEGEEFGGYTLNELVNWADNLLRDPNPIREEQELVKDLLDYANNLHQVRYCSTPPTWYNPAFTKKADEEDSTDELLTASLQNVLAEGDENIEPETLIHVYPAVETTSPEAYFEFSSSDPYGIFQCQLNGQGWEDCFSPQLYEELLPGEYQFEVFSISAYGVEDSTPAIYSWRVIGEEEPIIEEATTTESTATTTEQGATSTEPVCEPTEEICDGIDNDCDEEVDEEGVCETTTTATSTATTTEQEATSTEPVCEPTEEICDGVDNDCDELIDEEGICEISTTTESTATTTEQEATSTEPVCEPTEEICDGIDNDCDGEIDEELTQQCGSTDIGICQYGTQSCEAGIWSECQGSVEPGLEVCGDQLDNNCDGQIDENCPIEEATTTEETATSTPEETT